MTQISEFLPLLVGLALSWFVIMGARELYKEASSAAIKKTNA